jgi:hypothetical protein
MLRDTSVVLAVQTLLALSVFKSNKKWSGLSLLDLFNTSNFPLHSIALFFCSMSENNCSSAQAPQAPSAVPVVPAVPPTSESPSPDPKTTRGSQDPEDTYITNTSYDPGY